MKNYCVLLCVALLAGCASDPFLQPTDPFRAMVEATLNHDFRSFKKTLGPSIREQYSGRELKELFRLSIEGFSSEYGMVEIGDFEFVIREQGLPPPHLNSEYKFVLHGIKGSGKMSGGFVRFIDGEWKISAMEEAVVGN